MTRQLFKLGTGVLTVCALIGTAGAADLRLPVKAPPLAPLFNWTSCYIGGYVGGAWNERDATLTDLGNSIFRAFSGGIVAGRLEGTHSWNAGLDDSFIGGGTLGCNWQPIGSPFVLGIEGEIGYLKLQGSALDFLLSPTLPVTALRATPDVVGTARIGDWYGMITGRLGYAAWDRFMIYAKGGAAFVPVRGSVVDGCNTVAIGCGNWTTSTAVDDTLTTWTAGGGVEWAFGHNWTLKGEYMFIGLDHSSTSCNVALTPGGTVVAGGPFCFNHDFGGGIHTAKVGLSYRFDSLFWR